MKSPIILALFCSVLFLGACKKEKLPDVEPELKEEPQEKTYLERISGTYTGTYYFEKLEGYMDPGSWDFNNSSRTYDTVQNQLATIHTNENGELIFQAMGSYSESIFRRDYRDSTRFLNSRLSSLQLSETPKKTTAEVIFLVEDPPQYPYGGNYGYTRETFILTKVD